jgi:hypothetical protein
MAIAVALSSFVALSLGPMMAARIDILARPGRAGARWQFRVDGRGRAIAAPWRVLRHPGRFVRGRRAGGGPGRAGDAARSIDQELAPPRTAAC